MRVNLPATAFSAALLAGAVALTSPAALAAPLGPMTASSVQTDSNLPIEKIQFRRRGGFGIGLGVGAAILGGAVIGRALAGPGYYGNGYSGGSYYGRSYYGDGYYARPTYYAPAPVYAAPSRAYEPGYGDDTAAYCFSRFRSYDPRSGTYLGFDGYRHPCP